MLWLATLHLLANPQEDLFLGEHSWPCPSAIKATINQWHYFQRGRIKGIWASLASLLSDKNQKTAWCHNFTFNHPRPIFCYRHCHFESTKSPFWVYGPRMVGSRSLAEDAAFRVYNHFWAEPEERRVLLKGPLHSPWSISATAVSLQTDEERYRQSGIIVSASGQADNDVIPLFSQWKLKCTRSMKNKETTCRCTFASTLANQVIRNAFAQLS